MPTNELSTGAKQLIDFNQFLTEQEPLPYDISGFALEPFQLGTLTIPRYNSVTVLEADILQAYYATPDYLEMRSLFDRALDDAERVRLKLLTRDFNCMFAAILLWSRHDKRWTPKAVRQLPEAVSDALCDFLIQENNRGATPETAEGKTAKKSSESTGKGFTTNSKSSTRKKKPSTEPTLEIAQSA